MELEVVRHSGIPELGSSEHVKMSGDQLIFSQDHHRFGNVFTILMQLEGCFG